MSEKSTNKKKDLERYFEKYSKNLFLIDSYKNKYTYSDFYLNALKLINYLDNKSVKTDSKILIIKQNSIDYLIILYACLLGGYVACPIDPTLKKEKITELKKLYKIDYTIEDIDKIDYKKCKADPNYVRHENTDYLIIGSSGTAGEPKGILFSSDSILSSAQSFSELAKYNDKTKILHCLPMFYMGGILDTFFACMYSGSTIILGKRFSITNVLNFWELPINYKCNTLFLTPSIVAFLCAIYKKPNYEIIKHVSEYRSIIATGSYLYPEIRENFYKIFKKKILSCYGATELVGPLTLQDEEDTFEDFCVGRHGKDVKILIKKDEEGSNIIMVKNPFFMKGYITNKGYEPFKSFDGYYDTGDIGDYKNNLLYIKGRKRNIIKKGGELIFLSLIENTALQSGIVLESVAIGKKDLIAGEEPYLITVFKKNLLETDCIEGLNKFLQKKLRPIEVPKKIITISKLPRTKSGKVIKKSLLKLLEN